MKSQPGYSFVYRTTDEDKRAQKQMVSDATVVWMCGGGGIPNPTQPNPTQPNPTQPKYIPSHVDLLV